MLPPGTAAEALMLNELPAVVEKVPLEAMPAALVVPMEVSPPLANAAPPVPWGIKKVMAMAGTGKLFWSVTLTTAWELTRPFLTRLEVLASSTIVSLYLGAAFLSHHDPGAGQSETKD